MGKGDRKISDETREKIRKKATGRKLSKETKEKIRQKATGRKLSDDTKEKIRVALLNRKQSKEAIEKFRKTRTGMIIKKVTQCQMTIRKRAKLLYGNKCAVCSWSEASCDAHHIIPVSTGGENIVENIIILCPNHHRLAHNGILTVPNLLRLREKIYIIDG
jgi:predicted restriction endonuclease